MKNRWTRCASTIPLHHLQWNWCIFACRTDGLNIRVISSSRRSVFLFTHVPIGFGQTFRFGRPFWPWKTKMEGKAVVLSFYELICHLFDLLRDRSWVGKSEVKTSSLPKNGLMLRSSFTGCRYGALLETLVTTYAFPFTCEQFCPQEYSYCPTSA